jgi:hypothetical protein
MLGAPLNAITKNLAHWKIGKKGSKMTTKDAILNDESMVNQYGYTRTVKVDTKNLTLVTLKNRDGNVFEGSSTASYALALNQALAKMRRYENRLK